MNNIILFNCLSDFQEKHKVMFKDYHKYKGEIDFPMALKGIFLSFLACVQRDVESTPYLIVLLYPNIFIMFRV